MEILVLFKALPGREPHQEHRLFYSVKALQDYFQDNPTSEDSIEAIYQVHKLEPVFETKSVLVELKGLEHD